MPAYSEHAEMRCRVTTTRCCGDSLCQDGGAEARDIRRLCQEWRAEVELVHWEVAHSHLLGKRRLSASPHHTMLGTATTILLPASGQLVSLTMTRLTPVNRTGTQLGRENASGEATSLVVSAYG